ncbi:glycosyltransferase family 4 protein [Mycoplasmatota bacterium WC44]
MKNVAIMIFSNSMGGAESVAEEILSYIDKKEFKVHLITNDEIIDSFDVKYITKHSIGKLFTHNFVQKLSRKVIGNEFFYKLITRLKLRKLENIIKENRIEVIHSHLIYDHYLSSLIRLNNVRKVMTIHGSHGLDFNIKSKYNFKPKNTIKIYSKANIITSACNYFINILRNNGLRNFDYKIIENGINLNLINEKNVNEINNDFLNLTYLGGNRIVKGWDILVKAVNILVHQYDKPLIILDVLRDVPIESDFYKMVNDFNLNDNFVFRGYIGNNDHLKYISKNNLYILPSRTEGIANTLMEAIGLGKPILATDVGGTSEVIKHMSNGFLCETTVESLVEGLIFFYDNKEKLNEFGFKNERIKVNYYWENIIDKYEDIYKV